MQFLSKHSNRAALKSTHDLDALLDEVLREARLLGASETMAFVNHEQGYDVSVRMGQVETVAFSEQQSIAVSVYFGCSKGTASSSDTSLTALKSMVLAAVDIARVSAADACFGLPERELFTLNYPNLDLAHPWALTPSEAISGAIALEEHALQSDSRLTNSDGVSISTHMAYSGFANSYGFRGMVPSTQHQISAAFVAKNRNKMQHDYAFTAARAPDGLMPDYALAQLAVERTVNRLDSRRLKTQVSPVILSSRVSSGLLGSFVQAISGWNLYRKNSFLLDNLGQSLFPDFISIYEQPHLLGALGSAAFDEEGVPTRANRFVDGGVLEQYVLGSYSARKLGLKTTANSGGVANLTLDATAGDLLDLIKSMQRGFLVTHLMGSGVNILTGDYSRGASGFWVEHGEIQFPVEEVTIAGNLRDIFRHIVAVGSDINQNIATRCGSIWIDKMMIAGEN